jgi:hypothetical protein
MHAEVKLDELRLIINKIFDHLQNDLGHKTIRLDEDNYWEVASDERYAPAAPSRSFEMGQLYHDWEFLSEILKDEEQAVSLMFIHAAPLLRYIGEKIGQ